MGPVEFLVRAALWDEPEVRWIHCSCTLTETAGALGCSEGVCCGRAAAWRSCCSAEQQRGEETLRKRRVEGQMKVEVVLLLGSARSGPVSARLSTACLCREENSACRGGDGRMVILIK